MCEANAELADVWAALVRPHDTADHFDRLAALGIVQLATERRPDFGQHRRAHREPARTHVDPVCFELLMEAIGVEFDQNLIERHTRRPRCLIVTRGCVHRMLSCATTGESSPSRLVPKLRQAVHFSATRFLDRRAAGPQS